MSNVTSAERRCLIDGTPGRRPARVGDGWWCLACYEWSRTHGWTDPSGRPRKRRVGDLMQELTAAARATSGECIILAGYATRPKVLNCGRFPTRARALHASRAVWMIANGDPGEAHVLHRCHRGEEGCINIRHLYLGDNDQNIRDMVGAGRQSRGTGRHSAKLSDAVVQEMRQTYAAGGVSYAALGARYGVSETQAHRVVTGTNWRHVS